MLCLTGATCWCSLSFNKRQHARNPSGGKKNEFTTSRRGKKVGHVCVFLKMQNWVIKSKMMHQEMWIINPDPNCSLFFGGGSVNPDKVFCSCVRKHMSRKHMFSPPQGRPVRSFLPDNHTTTKTTAQELTVSRKKGWFFHRSNVSWQEIETRRLHEFSAHLCSHLFLHYVHRIW